MCDSVCVHSATKANSKESIKETKVSLGVLEGQVGQCDGGLLGLGASNKATRVHENAPLHTYSSIQVRAKKVNSALNRSSSRSQAKG